MSARKNSKLDVSGVFKEEPLSTAGYFDNIDWVKNYKTKNYNARPFKENTYEQWMAHGAIPVAFRGFICNTRYIGRGELALYIKLSLFMDQYGICYPSYETLAEGAFKDPKQVSPLMTNLIERHFILRSSEKIRIPWLKDKKYLRHVYQRPSVEYTLARLHYIGFRKSSENVFLDVESFNRSVEALSIAYSSKAFARYMRDPDNAHLRDRATQTNVLSIKDRMIELYLRPEEQELVRNNLTSEFENARAKVFDGDTYRRRATSAPEDEALPED